MTECVCVLLKELALFSEACAFVVKLYKKYQKNLDSFFSEIFRKNHSFIHICAWICAKQTEQCRKFPSLGQKASNMAWNQMIPTFFPQMIWYVLTIIFFSTAILFSEWSTSFHFDWTLFHNTVVTTLPITSRSMVTQAWTRHTVQHKQAKALLWRLRAENAQGQPFGIRPYKNRKPRGITFVDLRVCPLIAAKPISGVVVFSLR